MADNPTPEEINEIEDAPEASPVPESIQKTAIEVFQTVTSLEELKDVEDINDPRLDTIKQVVQKLKDKMAKYAEAQGVELEDEPELRFDDEED